MRWSGAYTQNEYAEMEEVQEYLQVDSFLFFISDILNKDK